MRCACSIMLPLSRPRATSTTRDSSGVRGRIIVSASVAAGGPPLVLESCSAVGGLSGESTPTLRVSADLLEKVMAQLLYKEAVEGGRRREKSVCLKI